MLAFSGNLHTTSVFYVDDVTEKGLCALDVENIGKPVRIRTIEGTIAEGYVHTDEDSWVSALEIMLRLPGDVMYYNRYIVEEKVVDDAQGINEWVRRHD